MANNDDDFPRGPLPGTWAYTARVMAEIMPDYDWDRWKDEMKDEEMMREIEEREKNGE